jgi:hypothetical protein
VRVRRIEIHSLWLRAIQQDRLTEVNLQDHFQELDYWSLHQTDRDIIQGDLLLYQHKNKDRIHCEANYYPMYLLGLARRLNFLEDYQQTNTGLLSLRDCNLGSILKPLLANGREDFHSEMYHLVLRHW